MLTSKILKDLPRFEEHELRLNGKTIQVRITGTEDGPVLIMDHSTELEPHERESLQEELGHLSQDFRARRLWGRHTPKSSTWKSPNQTSSYQCRSSRTGSGYRRK